MRITNFKKFLYLLFPVLILTASCQKGVDIDLDNPPPIPDGVKDSTLLIKSIALTAFDVDSGAPEDSVKLDYFYDTVNRKIIATIDKAASSDYYPGEAIEEYSYDVNGLLINILRKYENGYVPDDRDFVSVKIDYDAEKVLQKLTVQNYKGDIRIVVFTKTSLPQDKYELKWTEPLYGSSGTGAEDILDVRAVFSKEGKQLKFEYKYSYEMITGGGLDHYTQIITTDTMIYDASGSINKILTNSIDTGRHLEENVVPWEVSSRHTKGDQLYNQQQLLFNGIANVDFIGDLFFGDIFGILSETLEYSKYPFQTVVVYDWWNRQLFQPFTSTVEFDNKDRLVKFRGFFSDDRLEPREWKITYYK